MAKSARASKIKTNNSKLKSRVFAPIETARTERLSGKLLELVSKPKPTPETSDGAVMDIEEEAEVGVTNAIVKDVKETDDMEVDGSVVTPPAKRKTKSSRIQKKKSSRSKASIVFPQYKSRVKRSSATRS